VRTPALKHEKLAGGNPEQSKEQNGSKHQERRGSGEATHLEFKAAKKEGFRITFSALQWDLGTRYKSMRAKRRIGQTREKLSEDGKRAEGEATFAWAQL